MRKNKEVIITLYSESTKLRSDQKTNPIKKINPNPLSNSQTRARGYNRRAQLLAYAHELRHGAGAPQLQWTFKNSRRKRNKWRWSNSVQRIRRLLSRFDGIKRKREYEPIVTEDYSDGEGSCNQERIKGRKGNSHFCNKLRDLFKEISRAWRCKNGGCDR